MNILELEIGKIIQKYVLKFYLFPKNCENFTQIES